MWCHSRREPLPKRVAVHACMTLRRLDVCRSSCAACLLGGMARPVLSGVSSTGLCQYVQAHHTVLMQLSSRGITASVRVCMCEGCDTCYLCGRQNRPAPWS